MKPKFKNGDKIRTIKTATYGICTVADNEFGRNDGSTPGKVFYTRENGTTDGWLEDFFELVPSESPYTLKNMDGLVSPIYYVDEVSETTLANTKYKCTCTLRDLMMKGCTRHE